MHPLSNHTTRPRVDPKNPSPSPTGSSALTPEECWRRTVLVEIVTLLYTHPQTWQMQPFARCTKHRGQHFLLRKRGTRPRGMSANKSTKLNVGDTGRHPSVSLVKCVSLHAGTVRHSPETKSARVSPGSVERTRISLPTATASLFSGSTRAARSSSTSCENVAVGMMIGTCVMPTNKIWTGIQTIYRGNNTQ